MKRLEYLNELINLLSSRQSRFIELRDQLLSQPKVQLPKKRLEQALRYEQLIGRIGELGRTIEALIDVTNLEKAAPASYLDSTLVERKRLID